MFFNAIEEDAQILCKKNLSGISMILEELNHGSYVHVVQQKMEDFIVRKMEEKSLRFAIFETNRLRRDKSNKNGCIFLS